MDSMLRLPFLRLQAGPRGLITPLLLGMGAFAQANPPAASFQTDQVEVRLVPATTQVRPGERLTVGLHQRIAPQWHTYWRNPGDSGLATRLSWQLPSGAQAGPIQWPIPQHFEIGPVTNYGYADAVTLLTEVSLPSTLPVGSEVPIQVEAHWLVCHEVCIPQKATLSLSLPVVAADAPASPLDPLITQARAQLPQTPAWSATVARSGSGLTLTLPAQAVSAQAQETPRLRFFPFESVPVSHAGAQTVTRQGDAWVLQLPAGEAPLNEGQVLDGVLVVDPGEGQGPQARKVGYTVQGTVQPAGAASPRGTPVPASVSASADVPRIDRLGLASALLLALLGGLVLNLMPCVFPVLSIKALALLQHSAQSPAKARLHGLAYTGGVLASFALLAAVLIVLKAGGDQVGWGFQFHSPVFVLAVAYLLFAVGLSLSGVFTLGQSVTGLGQSLADRSGYAGSFFAGVLATIVATPCTAPFMGGAIGFALTQPAAVLLAVFLSLGLGLALPYLLLSTWPALQRWMPRPGVWMERLKQVLAFPMYATTAWLIWVLAQQAGVDAVAIALAGLIAIAFAAWAYDSSRLASPSARKGGAALAVIALSGALGASHVGLRAIEQSAPGAAASLRPGESADSQPYNAAAFEALRAEGKPVFLNFTAAWCITCLVNERVALSQRSVQSAFQAQGITYLKGDWTRQDPAITAVLQRFGRSGVPLYVYYPPGSHSEPVVLPQLLTPGLVLSAIGDANRVSRSPPLGAYAKKN